MKGLVLGRKIINKTVSNQKEFIKGHIYFCFFYHLCNIHENTVQHCDIKQWVFVPIVLVYSYALHFACFKHNYSMMFSLAGWSSI